MKARIKGTKEFKEIGTVTFVDDNWRVFHAENVEFEQDSILTPDHWQDVRERAAIAAMQGLILSKYDYFSEIKISEEAIKYADALVEKIKGE